MGEFQGTDRRRDVGLGPTNGEWLEYKRQVLGSLDDLHISSRDIRTEIQQLKIDVAVLQTKAGVWGAVGGLMAGVLLWVARTIFK